MTIHPGKFVLMMFCLFTWVAAQDAKSTESSISAERIKTHIKTLSADRFEGRGPGTPGAAGARDYIIEQMKLAGLKPGPGENWIQPVPLRRITNSDRQLKFIFPREEVELSAGDDFVLENSMDDGTHMADAEAVFVGFGVQAPEFGWDDYKGLDCRGKILVMFVGDPLPEDKTLFNGSALTYYGRWTYKLEKAKAMGAAGCLIIHQPEWASYGWLVVQSSWGGKHMDTRKSDYESELALRGWIKWSIAEKLVSGTGKSLDDLAKAACRSDFKPIPLGVRVSGSITTKSETVDDENIMGTAPGRHPEHAKEWIIYTAHYDHLGLKENAKPGEDAVYNGAYDNASGCGGVLEIARAFGALKGEHDRSVMFLFVCSEEQGLLGSRYWVENPLIPLRQTVCNINIDGLNVLVPTRDLQVVGYGQSELEDLLAEVLKPANRYTGIDQEPEKGFYYRSDHFNFAKAGVPALYTKTGDIAEGQPLDYMRKFKEQFTRVHYHQPSDEFREDWPLSGGAADAAALFDVGRRLALSTSWPQWRETSEFRAARQRMNR